MIKYHYRTLLLAFIPILSLGQSSYFLKTFIAKPGYTVYGMPFPSIDTLSQNSFITGGFSIRPSNSANDTLFMDSYLQKTEIGGLTKWFKKYHLNGHHMAFTHLQVLNNKDILIGGQTNIYLFPSPYQHGTLLRTDSNGYAKWFRVYPYQKIYRLLRMKSGDVAVLSSDSGTTFAKYLKLAILDKDGNLKWCKKYLPGDPNGYNGLDLVEGKDKRILIVGYKTQPIRSFSILTDSLGNIISDFQLLAPNGAPRFLYSAVNYFDEGFYIVGVGEGNANNITGYIMKVTNDLGIVWYKFLQTLNGDSEFFDIAVIGRNNLIVFNEPENYGTGPQRSGFTFIDSNGVARKNFLFTPDSLAIIPDEFIQLKNGNILFSTMGQYFGVTDTVSNGFCKFTNITYPEIAQTQLFSHNNFSTVPGTFTYQTSEIHLYLPFDQEIDYICSTGPTGPLDSLKFPEPEDTLTETGILDHLFSGPNFKIFPNPADKDLFLMLNKNDINRNIGVELKINLINSSGQSEGSYYIKNPTNFIQLDVRDHSEGLYYISIDSGNGESVGKKILIQH